MKDIEIEIFADGTVGAWWTKDSGEILESLSGQEEGPHDSRWLTPKGLPKKNNVDPWILENGLCG